MQLLFGILVNRKMMKEKSPKTLSCNRKRKNNRFSEQHLEWQLICWNKNFKKTRKKKKRFAGQSNVLLVSLEWKSWKKLVLRMCHNKHYFCHTHTQNIFICCTCCLWNNDLSYREFFNDCCANNTSYRMCVSNNKPFNWLEIIRTSLISPLMNLKTREYAQCFISNINQVHTEFNT